MTIRYADRAKYMLVLSLVGIMAGCQRPAGQNGAEANMGGNQALSQNPNAMSESGMPRTGSTPLNEIVPNAADQYSNSSDEIPPPGRNAQ